MKSSIIPALSCPSSNIPLFMPNSEDQDTLVDENEQERYGSEATSPRKRNGSLAQGGDGPNSKRRTISGVYHHIWQATQVIIQKYISQKKIPKRQF